MDEAQIRILNDGGVTRPRVWKEKPTLFMKFSGFKGMLNETIEKVKRVTGAYGSNGFEFARDEREQELLWSARKESLYSLLALRKEGEELCTLNIPISIENCRIALLKPINHQGTLMSQSH